MEVQAAVANLEAGLAPNQDAEREFFRRIQAEQERAAADALRQSEEQLTLQGTMRRTTAMPRPNAYVPTDVGIPKPYGALAPFKPSEPGVQMRHFRAPAPRDIVI